MEGKWQILLAVAIVCCVLNDVQSVTVDVNFKPNFFKTRGCPSDDNDVDVGYSSTNVIKLKQYGRDYELKEAAKAKTTKATKIKYNQFYKGLKVDGYSVVLEVGANGCFTDFAYGRLVRNIEDDLPSLIPKISPSKALDIAREYEKKITSKAAARWMGASGSSPTMEHLHPQSVNIIEPKSHKLIYIDSERNKAILVYHIDYMIESKEVTSNPTYLVDAITGNMVSYWDSVRFVDIPGIGGNYKIGQYTYGSNRWEARKLDVEEIPNTNLCRMQNARAKLIHCQHKEWVDCTPNSAAYVVCCDEGPKDGDNGAYSQAADAFWFATAVEDMYKDWYKDYTIDNKYSPMCIRVHYGDKVDNAYWSPRDQCISFGDGNPQGVNFFPLTVADVVSHEMAHAFTDAASGLRRIKQTAAIDESFSDMAGTAFKNYLRGTTEWNLGYDVMREEMGESLRYMDYPPRDRKSIQCACDYDDSIDEHYTSGVYNKAFYILANKPDWTVRSAFAVFVRANLLYWSPQTNFKSGACDVAVAASGLGYNPKDVDDAFAQVGVFCNCPDGFTRRNDCSCYKFVTDRASWIEAKVFCEAIGAKLVSVETQTDLDWIVNYIKGHQSEFRRPYRWWVGGFDVQFHNDFKWVATGEHFPENSPMWIPGDPDNHNRVEHCMALTKDSKSGVYGLYDDDCFRNRMYICKKSC